MNMKWTQQRHNQLVETSIMTPFGLKKFGSLHITIFYPDKIVQEKKVNEKEKSKTSIFLFMLNWKSK